MQVLSANSRVHRIGYFKRKMRYEAIVAIKKISDWEELDTSYSHLLIIDNEAWYAIVVPQDNAKFIEDEDLIQMYSQED